MCVCGCDNTINPRGPTAPRARSSARNDSTARGKHEREDKKDKKPSVSADSQLVPKPVLMRPKQA